MISPLLANIYLHYVFDEWIDAWRKRWAKGEVIVVRYADDLVLSFEHRETPSGFWWHSGNDWRNSGLELHPDKNTTHRVRAKC